MSQRPITEIPSFIKALTPEGLRRKMLDVNGKMGIANHFFDISYVNGNWFAWFYRNENKLFPIKDIKNDIPKK